jgi:hypothetical protein
MGGAIDQLLRNLADSFPVAIQASAVQLNAHAAPCTEAVNKSANGPGLLVLISIESPANEIAAGGLSSLLNLIPCTVAFVSAHMCWVRERSGL